VKSSAPDIDLEITSAATRTPGRPGMPVVVAKGQPLPPISIGPRPAAKPRREIEADPELFDVTDVLEQVAPAVDADGRHYPRLQALPRNRERELELALKDQWRELSERCIQIAELCNTQQQQAAELQTARDALGDLDKSVGLLEAALNQQESETAAAKDALARTEGEMAALADQLEAAQNAAAQSQQRVRELKSAFDGRGAELASARQRIAALEADLCVKTAECERLAAPIEDERRQHREELQELGGRHEIEVGRLTRLLSEREQQLDALQDAHTRVARRYEELARASKEIETAHKTASDHIRSQTELIQVLESLLKVERDTAQGKIAEMTAALAQERAARVEAEQASATIRKDIVQLLPKLMARRAGGGPAPADDQVRRENAA
jgi:chromosome segregation ATPase